MFADLYSDLANVFNDWAINSPTGGDYVADMTLDYANRAQDALWSDPTNGWLLLIRHAQLTVSNLVATIPAASGLLLLVYDDVDQDGKPGNYYFKDGQVVGGFKFIPAFTKAAGHSLTIQFYQAPIEPVYCAYQVKLDAFTGSETEYLFFPKNLMLGRMQYLRCLDRGSLKEWDALKTDHMGELSRFKAQHQNVVEEPGIQVKDNSGKLIYIPTHNLRGGLRSNKTGAYDRNDRDAYRR